MADDLNQWSGIGRLGKDPETKYTSGGNAVTSFSMACNWKSANDEGTTWVPIVTFGKLAEICGKYLRKGSQVYVSGKFDVNQWETESGEKRSKAQIIGYRMQMLDSKPQADGQPFVRQPAPQRQAPQRQAPQVMASDIDDDDDIPF